MKTTGAATAEQAPQRTLAEFHPLITDGRTSGNGFHLISRQYPTGDVELTALQLSHDDQLRKGGGARRHNTDKSSMDENVLRKSQQRARTIIRRKCLSMEANRLLTLTFRENVSDLDEAWHVFKYFCKLMRWRYGEKFQYVAVPEYQRRGAVHFHLAVRGYYHFNTVRLLWRRAAGVRGGNIDFTAVRRRHGSETHNPKKIANYIAKYVSKQESEVKFNRRRYTSGGSILVPAPVYGWLAFGMSAVYMLCQTVEAMTHKPVQSIFESEGRYPLIHITT